MTYRKIWVDGHRVLVLREGVTVSFFAMKASLVPVGLAYRDGGNGWAILDFVPASWLAVLEPNGEQGADSVNVGADLVNEPADP